MKLIFLLSCAIIASANGYSNEDIAFARIETCRGCSLNRLPEVKAFVMEDAPKYDRVEVAFITGAPPELIMLDKADKELERLPLSKLKRAECIELLESKGFKKHSKDNSEF